MARKGKVPPQLRKFVKTKAQLARMGKGAKTKTKKAKRSSK